MPIKRSKHIVELSKDHHVSLLFCWKIRTGLKLLVDSTRVKKYVQYFWETHMQQHFNEEETMLFIDVNDALVKRALEEHSAIKEQVDAITSGQNSIPGQLKKLADTVDHHIRFEERELFPHLEKVLPEKYLEEVGEKLSMAHAAACIDAFEDEFWKPQR